MAAIQFPEYYGSFIRKAVAEDNPDNPIIQGSPLQEVFRLTEAATATILHTNMLRKAEEEYPVILPIRRTSEIEILDNATAIINPRDGTSVEAYSVSDEVNIWPKLYAEVAARWGKQVNPLPELTDELVQNMMPNKLVDAVLAEMPENATTVNVVITGRHLWAVNRQSPEIGMSQVITIDFNPQIELWRSALLDKGKEFPVDQGEGQKSTQLPIPVSDSTKSFGMLTVTDPLGGNPMTTWIALD